MTSLHLPGYTLQARLGQGAFGTVYRALWNGNFPCAVKVFEGGALHAPYLVGVLERIQQLPLQEGLLPVYAFDLEENGTPAHVSMALVPEGAVSWDQLVGKLSRTEAWEIILQLARTLGWLHRQGIVHGGLSGGNLFVMHRGGGPSRVLVCDAGQAWLGSPAMERLHDQVPYFPPDRWREPDRILREGGSAHWDVYAFGVLAWRLLHGWWPQASKLFDRVVASKTEPLTIDPAAFAEWLEEEPPPVWPALPADTANDPAQDWLLRCLHSNPSARPAHMAEVDSGLVSAFGAEETSASIPGADGLEQETDFLEDPPISWSAPIALAANPVRNRPAESRPLVPAAAGGAEIRSWEAESGTGRSAAIAELPAQAAAAHSSPFPTSPPPGTVPAPVPARPPKLPVFLEKTPPANAGDVAEGMHPWQQSASSARTPDGPQLRGDVGNPRESFSGEEDPGAVPERAASPHGQGELADQGRVPAEEQGNQAGVLEPAVASLAGRVFRTLLLLICLALWGGGLWYAAEQQGLAGRSNAEREEAVKAAEFSRGEASAAVERAEAAAEAAEAQRLAVVTASLKEWTEVAAGVSAARPEEPGALATWKAAATPLVSRLEKSLAAASAEPALASLTSPARWELANLLVHLDRKTDASPLLELLSREVPGPGDSGASPDPEKTLLSARVEAQRGRLLLDEGKETEALPRLQAASRQYEIFTGAHPDQRETAREYARTSLQEGQVLLRQGDSAGARKALTRVGVLLGPQDQPGFQPADSFPLSDSLLALAAMETTEGKLDQAIAYHMQAVRLLVAYDQEHRESVACRRRLAEGYFGLGQLLTKNGTPRDASVAFSEAVKLLTELSKEAPAEASYRLQLALTYNEVSQLIRNSRTDAAGAREALEYQNGSVTILRNLNETDPLNPELRQHLAASLVLNGELLESSGDSPAALTRHTEALALLEDLAADSASGGTEKLEPVSRRLTTRAWSLAGNLHDKAGRKTEAIASMEKAVQAAEGLEPGTPAEERLLAATRERLRKLKPGS